MPLTKTLKAPRALKHQEIIKAVGLVLIPAIANSFLRMLLSKIKALIVQLVRIMDSSRLIKL